MLDDVTDQIRDAGFLQPFLQRPWPRQQHQGLEMLAVQPGDQIQKAALGALELSVVGEEEDFHGPKKNSLFDFGLLVTS